MEKIFYRFKQFFQGLTATIHPEERAMLASRYSSSALNLFNQMPIDAQRHSLNVVQSLLAENYTDPDLLLAALLHDVGKVAANQAGVQISLWLRGPFVLLEISSPQLLEKIASNSPKDGWRYALHVHIEHPSIGAIWAAEAGCSKLTCWLINNHQNATPIPANQTEEALLNALKWADNRN